MSRALIITVVVGLSRSAPAQPCADAPINVIVQDRYAGLSPTPFDAMIGSGDIDDLSPEANTLDVEVAAGQRGEASVWVGIVSQLGEDDGGIQGFSVTPIVAGGLELIDATFDGTLAGSGDDALISGGFVALRAYHVLRESDGAPVISYAVVWSFTEPITLPKRSTGSVLRIDIGAPGVQPEDPDELFEGRIEWFVPADEWQGYVPVQNAFTVDGATRAACRHQEPRIRFVVVGYHWLRCDANGDAKVDIAGAVWVVSELFARGEMSACADATDCNDDGRIDLSDALYAVAYRFQGGPSPPPPYPECGEDTTEDNLSCDAPSACP